MLIVLVPAKGVKPGLAAELGGNLQGADHAPR
ncbi:MAG: hypothetical protein QOE55_5840 [Acidobacteriaceae bacterium]|nr:hypothetical protein [Acidobacteriaceae bacterium]